MRVGLGDKSQAGQSRTNSQARARNPDLLTSAGILVERSRAESLILLSIFVLGGVFSASTLAD